MARIADSITWALYESQFRTEMGVETGQAFFLEALLAMSTNAADTFIDRDWVDADGNDEPIPIQVIQGVFEYAKVILKGAPSTDASTPGPDVKSIKVGDNQVTYAATASERVTINKRALEAAWSWWWPVKKNKGK